MLDVLLTILWSPARYGAICTLNLKCIGHGEVIIVLQFRNIIPSTVITLSNSAGTNSVETDQMPQNIYTLLL